MAIGARITSWTTGRRWPWVVAAAGLLLTLPSLWGGLVLDDHFNRMVITQPEVYADALPGPLDTYNFFGNDPERNRQIIDRGLVPWWTDANLSLGFWRPITSLTQWLDYKVWPNPVWAMHLHSVLWYAAVVFAATMMFRRFMGVTVAAGLAALMFAVDESHGVPVGFLANRNSVIACLFSVLALIAHDRWRRDKQGAMAFIGTLMFALALLSAEAGAAALAYLAAYALCFDHGVWHKRLTSLTPYLVVLIAWRIAWAAMGYGVSESILYTDPLSEPLTYLTWVWREAPLMIDGQFLLPGPELLVVAWAVWPGSWWLIAALAGVIAMAIWPMVRTDRTARFFAIGTLLSLIPACATLPQNRNLMFVGIGACALLGLWLTQYMPRLSWRCTAKLAGGCLVVLHLIIAPLLMLGMARYPMGPQPQPNPVEHPPGLDALAGRDLFIVNHPAPMVMYHTLGQRAAEGRPTPAHARVFSHAWAPVTVERLGPKELRVRCETGLPDVFSYVIADKLDHLPVGDSLALTGVTLTVADTDDTGLPTELRCAFDRPLEDESSVWLCWRNGGFEPFTPPAVGQSVELPAMGLPFGLSAEAIDAHLREVLANR